MVDSSTPTTTDEAVRSATGSPKEDPATKSAREELKHTVISEKQQEKEPEKETGKEEVSRPATPDAKGAVPISAAANILHPPSQDGLTDQVSSPKKKRAHDEVDNDDHVDVGAGSKKNKDEQSDGGDEAASTISASDKLQAATAATFNGTTAASPSGAEPDKKRLRDQPNEKDKAPPSSSSSSAFAASGFAKLASSASPFGSLGSAPAAAGTPSLFGSSGTPAPSTATTASGTKAATTATLSLAGPPKLTFGGASAASPFANLPASNNKVFGSGFGSSTTTTATTGSSFGGVGVSSGFGGFGILGSGFGGAGGLTSFAKPGEAFKSAKPSRPFGAPESSEEESDGGDDAEEGSGAEEDDNGDDDDGDEAKEAEDPSKEKKKKQKLQKVVVDDGETGEATLLQVRARLYYMDKDLGGWKERGAGMLKINVPEQCVEYDRDGAVIPASFDASTLDDDSRHNHDDDDEGDEAEEGRAAPKGTGTGAATPPRRTAVRLIMRQDSTLRVILNTIVLAATDFKDRQTLKSTAVLFTAFEGPEAKPVNVQIKMNINNSKVFLSTMEGIQRELRGV